MFVARDDHEQAKTIAVWCKQCQQSIDFIGPKHSCDGTSELDHLHRRSLSLPASYYFDAFFRARPGRFRKPCSGRRALAPLSSRTGEDNRGTRKSTIGEELNCGGRVTNESPPILIPPTRLYNQGDSDGP